MNCREFRSLLADYVAGELDAAHRASAGGHLESCAACREEARGLSAAAAAFESAIPDELSAKGATDPLSLSQHPYSGVKQGAPSRIMFVVLRYAAIILIAFAGGYWSARSPMPIVQGQPQYSHNSVRTSHAADPFETRIARRFADAVRSHPTSSSLSWSLLSIARQ